MVEFVIKYWVEFVFGLIVTGGGLFLKRFWTLTKENQQKQQDEFYSKIKEEINKSTEQSQKDDSLLQNEIDDLKTAMEALRNGVLSLQGRQFKAECMRLLEEGHEITIEEFKDLDKDHDVYNALGGNHNGDHLYDLVKKKVENKL